MSAPCPDACHWAIELTMNITQSTRGKIYKEALITVRGDLRKMILSYPLDSSKNTSHYSFNRYPFQNHPHGVSNYRVPDIHIDLRCDQLIDKATETYLKDKIRTE
ncbi:hypothetical protein ACTXT7_007177 [Hymenolepis weldensis]